MRHRLGLLSVLKRTPILRGGWSALSSSLKFSRPVGVVFLFFTNKLWPDLLISGFIFVRGKCYIDIGRQSSLDKPLGYLSKTAPF